MYMKHFPMAFESEPGSSAELFDEHDCYNLHYLHLQYSWASTSYHITSIMLLFISNSIHQSLSE